MDEAQNVIDEISKEKKELVESIKEKGIKVEDQESPKEKIQEQPAKKQKKPKRPSKIKIKLGRLKTKIRDYFKNTKESRSFVKSFGFYIFAYGVPISYMVWAITVSHSYWLKIPAFGIAFYLIKEELPYIWGKLVSSKSRR